MYKHIGGATSLSRTINFVFHLFYVINMTSPRIKVTLDLLDARL